VRLLVATANRGKVAEFRDLLSGCGVELVTPTELGIDVRVVEAGSTYRENAELKAAAYSKTAGIPALADDSGLEVDALGGAPGLHSARYAGDNARDADRVKLLLKNLEGVTQERRTARFRCVIALAVPGREAAFFEGTCEGIIVTTPRGNNGFGYDPVFFFPELGKTMAELPSEVKNRVSHRGKAAALACGYLGRLARE
jgi:XTP/dITP diphosphohydrolase